METKAITNNFGQGMTNIPSDAICPDDTTSAEYNIIFRDGEHRPIQSPVNLFDRQDETNRNKKQLLYIHSYNNIKRCIFYDTDNKHLYWSYYNSVNNQNVLIGTFSMELEEINGITSIGNTLIISLTTEGHKSLHYFLWKQDRTGRIGYFFIGTRLPHPIVSFHLKKEPEETYSYSRGAKGGMFSVSSQNKILYDEKNEEDVKAFFTGLYSKNKIEIARNKEFCNPFTIRYAVKMFDGSYTNISVPIILFPSLRSNTWGEDHGDDYMLYTHSLQLEYRVENDLSDWEDIIKKIAVFISNPVDIVDNGIPSYHDVLKYDHIVYMTKIYGTSGSISGNFYEKENFDVEEGSTEITYNYVMTIKEEKDIIYELINSSVFYKVFEIDTYKQLEWKGIKELVRKYDLENITTLEQLDHDDYFSFCPISSSNIYTYNRRLNLSNISRGFYSGHNLFMPLMRDRSNIGKKVTSFVYINTNEGIRIVKNEYDSDDVLGYYYYYPDPRANQVDFYLDGEPYKTRTLKPHPLLNGAYYIENYLPNETTNTEIVNLESPMPTENTEPEQLQNEVWVSEVNNPFVFNASGVNTVGNGSIIGVVSNTTALSQGQFGQFPLICFTTDGIYALQTSETGIYSAAHPISREVCNNPKSIVATDHLVFFSSEKGLMMINGSQVTCVSQNLSGKTFYQSPSENEVMVKYGIDLIPSLTDFLREAMIAYDYRDNLLWILNPNHELCYILSIDSGAYALTTIPYKPVGTVNDYPDTIIETQGNQTFKSFSLINRQNINDDERRIDGFIFSRPMKLGDSLALKTPIDIRLIENLNKNAGIRIRLFVSDDLRNWTRTNSYRGRGYKYFKYNLIFEKMLATDTISGIVSRWQFRYGNKLR